MELPKANLEGVLAPLPLPSLLFSCSSSKSLSNLIKNNSKFAKMRFEKSKTESESQLMIHFPRETSDHLIDLDTDSNPSIGAPIEIKSSFQFYGFEVIQSCNGLLLLGNTYNANEVHHCIVCNPVTGQYIFLPQSTSRNVKCAFFVNPTTYEFKVFRASHRVRPPNPVSDTDSSMELDLSSNCSTELDPFSDSDVEGLSLSSASDSADNTYFDYYDSDSDTDSDIDSDITEIDRMGELFVGGSDTWESLEDLPFSPWSIYSPCNLYQSTHWLCADGYVANIIVFFNFETHEFGDMFILSKITNSHLYERDDMSLVVLNGCLSIFDGYTVKGEFHIWVMREYGVWDSWSKDFVINTTACGVNGVDFCYKPIWCRSNGEVVMICDDGCVLIYDLVKKNGRVMKCKLTDDRFKAVAHTPSIRSLRNAFRGSNAIVLNMESRYGQLGPNYLKLLGTFSE